MTLAGTQNWELALLDVAAKNQGTAGASELDLEHFVGRWVFPRCSGYKDQGLTLLRSLHIFFSLSFLDNTTGFLWFE